MKLLISSVTSSSDTQKVSATTHVPKPNHSPIISSENSSSSFEHINKADKYYTCTTNVISDGILNEAPPPCINLKPLKHEADNFSTCANTTSTVPAADMKYYPPTRKISSSPGKANKEKPQQILHNKSVVNTTEAQTPKVLPTAVNDENEKPNCEAIKPGVFSQIDPLMMELECQVLPFYEDLTAIEKRMSMKYTANPYRLLLKQLTKELDLLLLVVGKHTEDKMLVLRKRGVLQEKQRVQLAAKIECERQKKEERDAEEARRLAQLKLTEQKKGKQNQDTEPTHHVMACQADFDEFGREIGKKRAKRNRRVRDPNRKRQNEQCRKPKKVEMSMQTVPDDYILCQWCNQHIPPENQCGHVAICRAGVKLKQLELEYKSQWKQRNHATESRKRQRLGLPVPPSPLLSNKQKASDQKQTNHQRSRSRNKQRDKSVNSKNLAAKPQSGSEQSKSDMKLLSSKLDGIHPNDLQAMTSLMQRLCTEPKCNRLAKSDDNATKSSIKCPNCKRIYCTKHRELGMHSACQSIDVKEQSAQPTSISCGWSAEEKHESLRAALKERKTYLRQLRTRN